MNKTRVLVATATVVLCAATEPAASPPAGGPAPGTSDYRQTVVCEKQEVVGSRLARRRVCKTRAEWADERLQSRQELEQKQVRLGNSPSE